jgi:hypothetical protein
MGLGVNGGSTKINSNFWRLKWLKKFFGFTESIVDAYFGHRFDEFVIENVAIRDQG